MSLITNILGYIGNLCIQLISYLGYFGVFFLMVLESMLAPVPSELVMPFAGFLAAQGRFSFALVVLFSSLGSIIGSLLSYYMGLYGGNRFLAKYGKFFLVDLYDLKKTEDWFTKHGDKTIFISRFIPVVRHLISIPAGISKMNIKKFCIYTLIGATLWNSFLAYSGYILGENWTAIKTYSEPISITIAILILIAFIYFVYRHLKHRSEGTTSK